MKKIVFLIFTIAFILFSYSLFYDFSNTMIILSVPFLILIVTLTPFLLTKVFVFSPWAYLLYFTFLNVFLRAFCILFDLPDKTVIDNYFLLGQEKISLLLPSFIVLLGYLIITTMFLLTNKINFKWQSTKIETKIWKNKNLIKISILISIMSVLCFYKFIVISISSITLLDFTNFSNYRGVSTDLSEYNSNGYLRFGIQLIEIILYFNFNYVLSKRNKIHFLNYLFIFISIIIAFAFHIFVQSRSGVLMICINLLIFRYIFIKNKISKLTVIFISIFSLSIFGFLTSVRQGSGYKTDSISITYPLEALQPFIVNNGGIDISKTGKIIDYVNNNNDFKFGSSLTWNFIAWVPRNFWKDKPVNIDTEVGSKIYGATAFGTGAVPPGLFGEMYWNFSYLGIIVGSIFVGFILSITQKYFNNKLNNINSTMIYILCFSQLSIAILGSSITSTVTGILFTLIPLLIINKFVLQKI